MPNNPQIYDAIAIGDVSAYTALLNSGFLRIYTGPQPALNGPLTGTLLASVAFAPTSFTVTAANGIVTAVANPMTGALAVATGTAGYCALVESDGVTTVTTGDVGTTPGFDLVLSTLNIVAGTWVACNGFVITMPET